MQYTAVSPTGQTITTVTAHSKWEAKNKLEVSSLLLFRVYRKEWKIITEYTIVKKIEQGILKACFGA